MREIKFRAWDKKNKRMNWYGFWVGALNGKIATVIGSVDCKPVIEIQQDNFILEQYTGLKDKNGKEIYEGDIVRVVNVNWQVMWNEYEMGWRLMPYSENGVTFDRAHEVFRADAEVDDYSKQNRRKEIEIIGNVHTTPELMEKE